VKRNPDREAAPGNQLPELTLAYRIVDAFASRPFGGNPAAVVLPPGLGAGGESSREAAGQGHPAPLSEPLLQAIAAEMNLSETAFPGVPLPGDAAAAGGEGGTAGRPGVPALGGWESEAGPGTSEAPPGSTPGTLPLRWFTPTTEVSLCGHATLAAAHALAEAGVPGPWHFTSRSGPLVVQGEAPGRYRLDFPADPPREAPLPPGLAQALGLGEEVEMVFAHGSRASLLELRGPGSEEEMRERLDALAPDMAALGKVALPPGVMGVSVTVRGSAPAGVPAAEGSGPAATGGTAPLQDLGSPHFHSRFFGPWVGVDEDPVTGMAHCLLGPWWALRLGTSILQATQGGPRRGGALTVEVAADRVHLVGDAVTVAEGRLRTGPRW
jgi:predicted PhzF superfamily epimerase YddE/YHI9